MRYFNEVPFWKILLKNTIVGLLLSPLFFMADVGFHPINFVGTHNEPTLGGQLLSVFFILLIIFFMWLSNFFLWYGRKKNAISPLKNTSKSANIAKLIITLVISVTMICWPWVIVKIADILSDIIDLFR